MNNTIFFESEITVIQTALNTFIDEVDSMLNDGSYVFTNSGRNKLLMMMENAKSALNKMTTILQTEPPGNTPPVDRENILN